MTVFPNGPFAQTEESTAPERVGLQVAPEKLARPLLWLVSREHFPTFFTQREQLIRVYMGYLIFRDVQYQRG